MPSCNEGLSDDELLSLLGVETAPETDVTNLVHVRASDEIKAAEEIARRNRCENFAEYKPIFAAVQRELDTGARKTIKFGERVEVAEGDLFILDGQKVLVAQVGDEFLSDYGRPDRRLKMIYDNGAESDLLLRSLQRALYKDNASRRITKLDNMPLFSGLDEEGDLATGHIYVLRSQSDHPFVAEHRTELHKLGITGNDVKSRLTGVKKDPTFLLADVELVATCKLANINRAKLEALLHKVFSSVRLDVALKDRFGSHVEPREWFLVPLGVIDDAIEKLKAGTLVDFRYDPPTGQLVRW